MGRQNIPLKELTKPLTVETKLWCDTTSENLDTGDSETPVTNDIYPTNSSITSSNEICGTVLDSRPQTRALTRASLKLNSLSSVQASTEERISITKISSDNVQSNKSVLMNHESSLYNSDVSNKYRSPTEISPMTTDLAECKLFYCSQFIVTNYVYINSISNGLDHLTVDELTEFQSILVGV